MKNYEKYADEIREYEGNNFCDGFTKPYILEADNCNGIDCQRCAMLQLLWLMEEYKEPKVDWSKVEIDTPILVRQGEDGEWLPQYCDFADNCTRMKGRREMTRDEAIKFAKENILAYTSEMAEFKELAIEALEKQVPKMPIDNTEREWFECPTCGRAIVTYYGGKRHNCKCGQALNWEGIK